MIIYIQTSLVISCKGKNITVAAAKPIIAVTLSNEKTLGFWLDLVRKFHNTCIEAEIRIRKIETIDIISLLILF